MLNKPQKNSSCELSGQMVSYLYGESIQSEKSVFEAHLTNCSECTEDLAGFGFVRSSVIEWRDQEFSKLDAPVFIMPTINAPIHQTINSAPQTWFSDLRRLLSFNPLTAAAFFAASIICVGLIFIVLKSSKTSDVAELDNKNVERIIVSPSPNRLSEESKPEIAVGKPEKSSGVEFPKSGDAESKDSQSSPIREKRNTQNNSNLKAQGNAKSNSEKSETIRNVKDANRENKKTTATQKQTVPNLTDLDDDEDKSVRLADLFEEIGTK